MIHCVDFTHLYDHINTVYIKYLTDYRRYQIFKGGAGAGKSVFIAQKIIYNMIEVEGYNGLILRKVGKDNHDSTFAEICKAIKAFDFEGLFDINHSRGAEEITCKPTNNKVVFRGLDDVDKLKSITFETGDLVFIWIEEADETSEDDLKQLNLRLRGIGKIKKHIIMSFNPIDETHWIKARFFDNPLSKSNGYICETTYKDNEFIDTEYKNELEGYKDEDYYYYMVYALNMWGKRTTARIFNNIKIHDFNIPEYHMQNIRYGQDYGFNHANAMEGCGFIDGELYIFKEFYKKHQLNKDFIDEVENSDFPKDYDITGESAEPDKIVEWNNAGFKVEGAKKGKGSLKAGVDYLKALPCIHIHKTNCPNAAREFPRYKYKELKDGTVLDEILEKDDDTIAAIRYAVEDLVNCEDDGHYFIKR